MGFRQGRSTISAITELVCHINQSINVNNFTVCAFIDFKKAFDGVNFNILTSKLIDIGICSN